MFRQIWFYSCVFWIENKMIILLSGNPVICYFITLPKKPANMYYSNFGIFEERSHFQWLIQKNIYLMRRKLFIKLPGNPGFCHFIILLKKLYIWFALIVVFVRKKCPFIAHYLENHYFIWRGNIIIFNIVW